MPDETTDTTPAEATHRLRPATPRWTHVALRVSDLEATIAWYRRYTTLEVLDRREDEHGFGAWLGHPDVGEHPFVLVVAQFHEGHDPAQTSEFARLAPFAHLGIELPERADVDEIAARGTVDGCLAMEAMQLPDPVGYVCMLRDPDGNLVEFSFDQGVYEKVREVWG